VTLEIGRNSQLKKKVSLKIQWEKLDIHYTNSASKSMDMMKRLILKIDADA